MNASLPYRNRVAAGRALGQQLKISHRWRNPLVLALPRGGVPVAAEVASALDCDFDVLVVRKIGLPWQPELAMGAIASGGTCIRNAPLIRAAGVTDDEFLHAAHAEREELRRRERRYRGSRPLPAMAGRTVILVDDGLATGSTMQAAIAALRSFHPAEVIVAAPVGAADTVTMLEALAEEVVCLATPEPFHAVGAYYDDFSPTRDDEVESIIAKFFAKKSQKMLAGAPYHEA